MRLYIWEIFLTITLASYAFSMTRVVRFYLCFNCEREITGIVRGSVVFHCKFVKE